MIAHLVILFSLLAAAPEDGFTSLFDGKTLAGWYGPTDGYEVKDGAISARPGRGGTIYTRQTFSDFIVRFEFKLSKGADSGLALRYPGSGHPAYVGMCELQIRHGTEGEPRTHHGAAYGLAAPKTKDLLLVDAWNVSEVTVKGSTIKVLLNGEPILETDLSEIEKTMDDHPHPGKDRESGHFGITGDTHPVQFRNIRIKKL